MMSRMRCGRSDRMRPAEFTKHQPDHLYAVLRVVINGSLQPVFGAGVRLRLVMQPGDHPCTRRHHAPAASPQDFAEVAEVFLKNLPVAVTVVQPGGDDRSE